MSRTTQVSSAAERCPFKPTSPQYRSWVERYEKALADAGLDEDEVMSTSEVFEWAGVSHNNGRSMREACRSDNYPDPPSPAFWIVRVCFYRRAEIEEWLAPAIEARREAAARAAARREAVAARSARRAERLYPVRSACGYSGVRKQALGETWGAYFYRDGYAATVGNYRTAEEAALAVDKFRMLYGFEPINFPDRVDEHDQVEILVRRRATEGSDWVLSALGRHGRCTVDKLWQMNQQASASQRFKTERSLVTSLYRLVRLGQVAKVDRGTFELSARGDTMVGQ